MIILAAYKAVLSQAPAISSSIYIGRFDQGAPKTSILLELPEQGGDYTHSGPVGLFDAHIRVTCRAEVDSVASALGEAAVLRLQDWQGTQAGCRVQMTEHFNTSADFDSATGVFRHISEYTAFFTRVVP